MSGGCLGFLPSTGMYGQMEPCQDLTSSLSLFSDFSTSKIQRIFQVPVKGGRDYITP